MHHVTKVPIETARKNFQELHFVGGVFTPSILIIERFKNFRNQHFNGTLLCFQIETYRYSDFYVSKILKFCNAHSAPLKQLYSFIVSTGLPYFIKIKLKLSLTVCGKEILPKSNGRIFSLPCREFSPLALP